MPASKSQVDIARRTMPADNFIEGAYRHTKGKDHVEHLIQQGKECFTRLQTTKILQVA